MTTTTTALTTDDILNSYDDGRWCGWGYLGERSREEDAALVARADAYVIEVANAKRWSRENLFQWLNSRPGRHYGDLAFGCGQVTPRPEHLDSYFPLVKDGE